jgi:glyoxylase-like metal-dependent hydrolase (beta-lactamase superfamily II)
LSVIRIIQIDTAYQLTYFKNESLSVNCYLLEEENGLTLIDTAIHESFSEIIEAINMIGKPITNIVLTHAHHDHIGGLDAINQAFPEIPVHISAREARLLAGDLTIDPDEPNTPIRGIIPLNIKTQANVLLQDGDHVGSLLSLATPGHTPGSMSFLDTRNRILFAGDSFQTAGGIAVAGQLCPTFPFPAKGTWNKQVSLKSARRLLDYQPSLLAVGHGEMLEQPCSDMAVAIAEAEINIGNESIQE